MNNVARETDTIDVSVDNKNVLVDAGKVRFFVDQLVDKVMNAANDEDRDTAALALFRQYGVFVYPY